MICRKNATLMHFDEMKIKTSKHASTSIYENIMNDVDEQIEVWKNFKNELKDDKIVYNEINNQYQQHHEIFSIDYTKLQRRNQRQRNQRRRNQKRLDDFFQSSYFREIQWKKIFFRNIADAKTKNDDEINNINDDEIKR